jgi:hypothetical protein
MSKASAKYNGMENVSGRDRTVNGVPKNTRRKLHAVKKLRRRASRGVGRALATTGKNMMGRFRAAAEPRHVELQQLLSGHLRSRRADCRLYFFLFLRRRPHRGHAEHSIHNSRPQPVMW